MRQAVCVLNASVFEGFGLSLAESTYLGKRALVSDLPAHHGQNPPDAVYFDPHDVETLADKMAEIWNTTQPGPDLPREAAAQIELPRHYAAVGNTLLDIMSEAAARYTPAKN
jgi:hypothetical protein